MEINKVELKEEEMKDVIGGIQYDSSNMTVGKTNGPKVYKYSDFNALNAWASEHVAAIKALKTTEERDNYMIEGLLEAGIIHHI